jgi:hypothetical protein
LPVKEEEVMKVMEGNVFSFTCSSLGGKPLGTVRQDSQANNCQNHHMVKINESIYQTNDLALCYIVIAKTLLREACNNKINY